MYWHVMACIDIYTPKKPRIHESCIRMYSHVSHMMSFSAFPENQLNPAMRDIGDTG